MIYQFVVSFVLGIVFEQVFHFGWTAALLVCLISIAVFLTSRFAKIFLIIGVTFSLGILRMSFTDISSDLNLYKSVGQTISFTGSIVSEPDVRDASARYIVKTASSTSLILLVS